VRIKVERSGGFTGISVTSEMDGKDLPSDLMTTAKNIVARQKSSSLPMKSTPKGAADHYTYKISIINGGSRRVIECNQYNIQDDLKSLVKYVEKNSKKDK
jgi:Emfourin